MRIYSVFFLSLLSARLLACPFERLLAPEALEVTAAENLARGFDPAKHLKNGAIPFGNVDHFVAGERFAQLEARGLQLSPQGKALALGYRGSSAFLAKKAVPMSGTQAENYEMAMLAHTAGIPFDEKPGLKLEIPARESPGMAETRLKYLLASSMWLPEGQRGVFLQQQFGDFRQAAAEKVGVARLLDGSYRPGKVDPSLFDAQGKLLDPKNQANLSSPEWFVAGVAMPGQSMNPKFRGRARIFYWNTAKDGKGLGNIRVAENYRKTEDGWVLDGVEFIAKRGEPDDWVPLNSKPTGEGSKLELERGRDCFNCHASAGSFATSFGPRPKRFGPIPMESSPFSRSAIDAATVWAHQQDFEHN